MPITPLYLDWKFWGAVAAFISLVLSQLPPVRLWFRPRRLEVEVHSRIQFTHTIGNPNLGMFVSVRNTGGRELRVRAISVRISRNGKFLVSLPAQNFHETLSTQAQVLFVPFTLKPEENWAHSTNFYDAFDRATDQSYREHASAMSSVVNAIIRANPEVDKTTIVVDQVLVKPFLDLYGKLFVWIAGEYVIELVVNADPGSASFAQNYRFTLYESDSNELGTYTRDYGAGGGIAYYSERHTGIYVPIQPHLG